MQTTQFGPLKLKLKVTKRSLGSDETRENATKDDVGGRRRQVTAAVQGVVWVLVLTVAPASGKLRNGHRGLGGHGGNGGVEGMGGRMGEWREWGDGGGVFEVFQILGSFGYDFGAKDLGMNCVEWQTEDVNSPTRPSACSMFAPETCPFKEDSFLYEPTSGSFQGSCYLGLRAAPQEVTLYAMGILTTRLIGHKMIFEMGQARARIWRQSDWRQQLDAGILPTQSPCDP